MIKILLTNNFSLVDKKYHKIYTDSPYVVNYFKEAIYLDTLLEKNLDEFVNNIRIEGYEINKKIIEEFFPNYENRNIDIVNIKSEFTNIFINILKLFKLVELYPNSEITIKVTTEELYNYRIPDTFNRFVNVYYWIANIIKIKNIKLICKNKIFDDLNLGHSTIDSWFLRLVDLDKKVLTFNFLKKFNLIKKNKKKIYRYKNSNILREIEPYLYDLGFNLIDMPEIKFKFEYNNSKNLDYKLTEILSKFFQNSFFYNSAKKILFEIYKKKIEFYLQKEKYTNKYIQKLDKSINTIITNTINGFDSHIFAQQLQRNNFKIINVRHGLTTSFLRKEDLLFYDCQAPDLTLCFNNSEKDFYKTLVPYAILRPISVVQEAKKKRLRFLKRFYLNRKLKLKDKINIFYPSIIYPYNNFTIYKYRKRDKWNFEFEKKMISLFSNLNKRVIYKHYPMRSFIDQNPLIKYAESFKNIKVIDKSFDFRYVTSIGDIFILGFIGGSSTVTWMLGENKPIIYLYTNKSRFINEEAKKILDKILIVINIDEDKWEDNLKDVLNKPYEELHKIWKEKQKSRDEFDEEWLMGTNLHAGKLGSKYIKEFIYNKKK